MQKKSRKIETIIRHEALVTKSKFVELSECNSNLFTDKSYEKCFGKKIRLLFIFKIMSSIMKQGLVSLLLLRFLPAKIRSELPGKTYLFFGMTWKAST